MTSGYYSFVDDKIVPVGQTLPGRKHEDMPSKVHDYNAYRKAWRKTPKGSAGVKRSAHLWEASQYDHGVRVSSLLDSAAVQQGARGKLTKLI